MQWQTKMICWKYAHNDANNNSLTNFLYSNFLSVSRKTFSIHTRSEWARKSAREREQLPSIWDMECGKSRPNGFHNRLQHRWMIEEWNRRQIYGTWVRVAAFASDIWPNSVSVECWAYAWKLKINAPPSCAQSFFSRYSCFSLLSLHSIQCDYYETIVQITMQIEKRRKTKKNNYANVHLVFSSISSSWIIDSHRCRSRV